MIAREYIDKNLQPELANARVENTINYLLDHRLNEIFIFNESKELFLVKFSDIIFEDKNLPTLNFAKPFTLKLTLDMHWSQLIPFFKTMDTEVLPLYNLGFEFTGLVSKNNLIDNLDDFNSLQEPGAILILQCDMNFYAASEVIRIAEMYNARVISLLTHQDNLTGKLIISLKVNVQETSGISNTYERFGYEVNDVFMNKDFGNDVYAERYESLIRLLDIK